jgi:hypothetical protein
MKAQFWSFDVIFAIIIFSLALSLITFVWLGITNQFSVSYGTGTQTMQMQLQSMQSRITGAGVPANWNVAMNVINPTTWNNISIGLGTGAGIQLSQSKIMTFMAMSNYNMTTYQATKSLLGIGYDYYMLINSTNYTIVFGLAPYYLNPYAIMVARQSAFLNGVPVTMQLLLWTNKSFGVS